MHAKTDREPIVNKTTNIQIYADVKEFLLEKREGETESYNDILRRLLGINEPKKEPEFGKFAVEIIIKRYDMDELYYKTLTEDLGRLKTCSYVNTQRIRSVNGVDVFLTIEPVLRMVFLARSRKEAEANVKAILKGLEKDKENKNIKIKITCI